MLEIGPKIKVAEWPEVWGKAYNFPKMCTSSLVVIRIPNYLATVALVTHCPPFTYIYTYIFLFIFIDIIVTSSTAGLYN